MSFEKITKDSINGVIGILNSIEPDRTAEIIEKGAGHKYYKREGVPGKYKYYYTEEEYKQAKGNHDQRFKFKEGTKVSFVKNGETINGVISDYDYNSVTFDKEYNVDYKKDGKTLTMIGIPEDKIQELNEDSKSEIYSKEQKEKLSQYQQMMDEYEEKAKELKLLDGWKPSFIANSVYKNFGEDSFINGGSIDAHFDIAKKETYFSVNVGYNSFTHEEEQKKFFPKLYELRDKRFSTAKEAEEALSSFMSDWDKERSEILKKVK